MLRRLVNFPFSVAGKAARAFQAREDARTAVQYGRTDDPGLVANNTHTLPPTQTEPELVQIAASATLGKAMYVLDVRDAGERFEVIPGSVHMPMLETNVRVSELPPDQTVVVYCTDGSRSTKVACFFRDRGMEDTWAITGGLVAWKAAGGKVAGPSGGSAT
ncbi:MAG: rhodanese-like domain-containing protein [Myxococcales bacterium]|nr:rhodanese-like domain-containing protein [Myxococcales bacterium]